MSWLQRVAALGLAVAAAGVIGVPGSIGITGATALKRRVALSPRVIHRGHFATVTGSGWKPSTMLEIGVGPPRSEADILHRLRTTRTGTFRWRLHVAAKATPGPYVLIACQNGCRIKTGISFRIVR